MEYIQQLKELESFSRMINTNKDNWIFVFEKGDLIVHLTYSIDYHTFLINVYKVFYKGLRHLERKYLDNYDQVFKILNIFNID